MQIVAVQSGPQHEPRLDTRALAEAMGNQHKNVMELIRKYQSDFEALGQVPFETEVGQRAQGGGMAQIFATLNEGQCYFLLTLVRNTEQTVPMKRALIEKVMAAFNLIKQQQARIYQLELQQRGRAELVLEAKRAAIDDMAGKVCTAAQVGAAYGGGRQRALDQLSLKGIHPVGYFVSVGQEVEVYPMLDVFQQFRAGGGPPEGRSLQHWELDWTPYPERSLRNTDIKML